MAWTVDDVLDERAQAFYDWRKATLKDLGVPEPYREIIARETMIRVSEVRAMIVAGCDPVLAAKIVL